MCFEGVGELLFRILRKASMIGAKMRGAFEGFDPVEPISHVPGTREPHRVAPGSSRVNGARAHTDTNFRFFDAVGDKESRVESWRGTLYDPSMRASENLSQGALAQASPTESNGGRTPASQDRRPNAMMSPRVP